MKSLWPLTGCLLVLLVLPACTRRNGAPQPARSERSVVTYAGEAGKSALELLKQNAETKTQTFPFGELVVEINGVRSGNGYDFLYYVNGTMVKTGAAYYVTKSGEQIEWKLVGPRSAAPSR